MHKKTPQGPCGTKILSLDMRRSIMSLSKSHTSDVARSPIQSNKQGNKKSGWEGVGQNLKRGGGRQ